MRLLEFFASTVMLACCLSSAQTLAQAQTSFGPEISAEDFSQHKWALSSVAMATPDQTAFAERSLSAYLEVQFERLGLSSQDMVCSGKVHGLQVILPGTEPATEKVVYLAQWRNAYQSAGVLEIAERFMTQKPRPKHDVAFIFLNQDAIGLTKCPQWRDVVTAIQPKGLDKLDSASLVIELNALYTQGK